MSLTRHSNAAYDAAAPKLSVLVPFYRDDASALVAALDTVTSRDRTVEVLVYDDGTNDADLTERVKRAVEASTRPALLMSNRVNKGRSAARNALQAAARAPWILFLDADMRPDNAEFLNNYLDRIEADDADVLFGGFTVEAKATEPDRELHRALSEISDCLDAAARTESGPQFVASSNLCVRKSVLGAEGFDPGFKGWGWEDSEWAARVAARFTLVHLDNPAVHLGLETTDTLLDRFATSGPNYLRFTQLHPDLARSLALFRISRKLRRVPGQRAARPVLRALVRANIAPLRLRLAALKLWRASHYADVMT